ncbi:MAG: serine/threonine protein kinase, partial [Candidatus Paceibacteria bacterium]
MDADPQSDLPELEAAIDEYIDWAESEALDDCLLPLPAARARMLQSIGDRIGGFEIERRLGAGGMGLVFLARQLSVDRRWVALKVLRTSFAEESVAERFRREVRALAALDHESIVPVLAADLESDPPFYAMPYVEGASASQLLRELRAAGELPPTMQALRTIVTQDKQEEPSTPSTEHWEETYHRWLARIFIQLAGALEHAHERGVLHRDVKPGNVMITPAGRAVLLDFGLASRTGDESLTVTGAFLGTLAYASPEQAAGDDWGVAADVYSLGSTLYHFLTLHQPFEAADRRELAHRIDHEEPDSVGTEVPVGLRNICRCAMAKSPQHRYASAGAMAHDLEAYLHGAPL